MNKKEYFYQLFNEKALKPAVFIFLACIAATSVGSNGFILQPLTLSTMLTLENGQIDELRASVLVSIEIIAVALTMFWFNKRLALYSPRTLGTIGAVIIITGNVVAMLANEYHLIAASRVIAGIGAGIVLALGNTIVARTRNPERVFGFVIAGTSLYESIILFGTPLAIHSSGRQGFYLLLVIVVALFALVMRGFRREPLGMLKQEFESEPLQNRKHGITGTAAVFVIFIMLSCVWVFAEQLGVRSGLNIVKIGIIFSIGTFLGFLAGLLAGFLGNRYGRTLPVTIGILSPTISCLCIAYFPSENVYQASMLIFIFTYYFFLPYILGTMAALDRRGRWAVIASGLHLLGAAISPVFGGLIVVKFGYITLSWAVFSVCLVSLAVLLTVVRFIQKKENEAIYLNAS